jgi:hypothetical protein
MAKVNRPKRLEDLPQFMIREIKAGIIDPDGYGHFTLIGNFDRLDGVVFDPWCWLLLKDNDCLCGNLQVVDKDSRECTFQTTRQELPAKVGQSLAHLSPYWQAFNVWMVLDPKWGWRRMKVVDVGVEVENKPVTEETRVGRRRLTGWAEVKREGGGPLIRYVPLFGKAKRPLKPKSLSQWSHENCTLCNSHIDARKYGYVDPDGRWMCLRCYRRYVIPRDLSFTD